MAANIAFGEHMFNVGLELGPEIIKGLANKEYERVGGVILDRASKEVVGLMRQGNLPLVEVVEKLSSVSTDQPWVQPLAIVLDLAKVNPVTDLSVSTMGFMAVMLKLNSMEQKLTSEMAKLNRKLDISFYANFQAALTQADNAFRMSKTSHRQTAAHNAINRFLEAEHHYLRLFDDEMEHKSLAAYPYLATLFLAYVSEARCYLELEEAPTARHRLTEAQKILKPRVDAFCSVFLTDTPAIFLHPDLQGEVDLARITRLLRFNDPGITENEVFEKLRSSIWELAKKPDSWLDSVPPALLPQEPDAPETKGRLPRPDLRKLPSIRRTSSKLNEALEKLPEVFGTLEDTATTYQNLQGFEMEIDYFHKCGGSFADWQQLVPPNVLADQPLVFLLPSASS